MSKDDDTVDNEEVFVDELKPGTSLMLGQYTIERFLAAGGFGITYLATDSLNRRVVIKECFPGSFCRRQNGSVMPRSRSHQDELKSIVRHFSKEARTLAKAGHPNVVGVHQVFEENNTAYMALDYVEGRNLLEILKDDRESLRPEQVQNYLSRMLDAIGHVHAKGLLHRDISPDNIIISTEDEPVLIDFGAARETADKKASRLLSALRVVKDGYSPQEFYIAGSKQGPSCDLYSLAASFYHIITGDLPPASQARLTAFAAEEPDPYVPLAERSKEFPQNFATALDKALSILPKDRMQSAEDWLAHIEHGEKVAPIPPTTIAATPANTNATLPKPMLLGGTALAAVAGVALVSFAAQPSGIGDAAVEPAQTARASEPARSERHETQIAAVEPEEVEAAGVQPSIFADVATPPEVNYEAPLVEAVEVDEFEGSEFPEEPVRIAVAPEIDPMPEVEVASFEIATPMGVLDMPTERVADTIDGRDNRLEADDIATVAAVMPETEAVAEDVTDITSSLPIRAPSAPVLADERTAFTTTNANADIGANEASSVMEVDVLSIPFTLSSSEPGFVETVADGAPFWLSPGVRILSVNGTSGSDNAALRNLLFQAVHEAGGEATVTIGTDARLSDAAIERRLTIGSERQTALMNGLVFVSSEEDGVMVTRVTKAPAGSSFRVGDKVVAYMATAEKLDQETTLKSILDRELAAGRTSFSFAVERQGAMWVEAFNLAALTD